ncbi:MAG: exodeoxyribonuclease VII small subunit [Gemmatimonas sp.]
MTFEQSLDRLEEIVGELEGVDLEMERALALFEEGLVHLRAAHGALQLTDARVQVLTEAADGVFSMANLDSRA